jgi:hypothetical protein
MLAEMSQACALLTTWANYSAAVGSQTYLLELDAARARMLTYTTVQLHQLCAHRAQRWAALADPTADIGDKPMQLSGQLC